MKFFDNLFDINDTNSYSVSGLNMELNCINIYDTFIRNNNGMLIITSSTYTATESGTYAVRVDYSNGNYATNTTVVYMAIDAADVSAFGSAFFTGNNVLLSEASKKANHIKMALLFT